jgi:hypothetical protein
LVHFMFEFAGTDCDDDGPVGGDLVASSKRVAGRSP